MTKHGANVAAVNSNSINLTLILLLPLFRLKSGNVFKIFNFQRLSLFFFLFTCLHRFAPSNFSPPSDPITYEVTHLFFIKCFFTLSFNLRPYPRIANTPSAFLTLSLFPLLSLNLYPSLPVSLTFKSAFHVLRYMNSSEGMEYKQRLSIHLIVDHNEGIRPAAASGVRFQIDQRSRKLYQNDCP